MKGVQATFTCFVAAFTISSCSSATEQISKQPVPNNSSTASPTYGTNVYRYLSSISDSFPDDQALTSLCIRKHGFSLDLPKHPIKSAHNIRIPVFEEWTENQDVKVREYKVITVQPKPVNGIIMNQEEKLIPYMRSESRVVSRKIAGTCIGIEYLLG
jgi:hypothetical protein